jgi:hypothetical protein
MGNPNELQAERDGRRRRAQDQQVSILRAIALPSDRTPPEQRSESAGRIQTKASSAHRLLHACNGEGPFGPLMAHMSRTLVDQSRCRGQLRTAARQRHGSKQKERAPDKGRGSKGHRKDSSHPLLWSAGAVAYARIQRRVIAVEEETYRTSGVSREATGTPSARYPLRARSFNSGRDVTWTAMRRKRPSIRELVGE